MAEVNFSELKLVNKDGPAEFNPANCEHIGIYFSAHWCPPCRGFTPVLAEYYNKRKESDKIEIIFCSWDRDQGSFNEYFGEMPWLALDFGESDLKNKLGNTFGIDGIPTLVVVDKTGKLVCENARGNVTSDKPLAG